jgi:hypothetical protein
MLPYVDNQDFACGQREEGAFALKVLVLAALATVGALDIHDEDIVGHLGISIARAFPLVLGHPYSLCCLAPIRLRHNTELGAEEVVEQRRLARRLRAEDRDQMVVEAGFGDVGFGEVVIEVRAAPGERG